MPARWTATSRLPAAGWTPGHPGPVPGVPSRRPTGGRDAIPRPAARANVMAAPASRPAGLQERASRPGTGCRPGGPLHRGCRPAAGATLHRCRQPVGRQDTRGLFLAFLHDGRQAGVTPSRGRQPAQAWQRRHRGRQACRKGRLAREPDAGQVDRYIEAAGSRLDARHTGPVPGVPSRRPTGGRGAIPRPAACASVMAAPASRPAGLQERASRPGTGCRPGGPLHRGRRPAAGATLHRCRQPVGRQTHGACSWRSFTMADRRA